MFLMRSAPFLTRSISSGVAFRFSARSLRNSSAAFPVSSGVGAIGVAITLHFKIVKHPHPSSAGSAHIRNVQRQKYKSLQSRARESRVVFEIQHKEISFFYEISLFYVRTNLSFRFQYVKELLLSSPS